jgi:hypothetical protein
MSQGVLNEARKEYLQYLKKQNDKGLLDYPSVALLRSEGYIDKPKFKNPKPVINSDALYTCKLEVDEKIRKRFADINITPDLWKPQSIIYHTEAFFEWVNSFTFGYFPNKAFYEPFELYKYQAFKWWEENINPEDYSDQELKENAAIIEVERSNQNTLYFANKHGWFKDGSSETGTQRYKSKEANALLFYLIDCGYPILCGKPRQIWATTTVGLFAMKNCLTKFNFFMKLITEDDTTGQEILRDKIKYPFGQLPDWFRCMIDSDAIKKFHTGYKKEKGEYTYPNSRIEEVSPTITAVNGGSPNVVLIDEADSVPNLIDMIQEAMPTMYVDRQGDGNLELVRQLIVWSTGVSTKKGKGQFEQLWIKTITEWNNKNFRGAMFVPVFFSWHVRCNRKIYDEIKQSYYTGQNLEEGINLEQNQQRFHIHYPSTWRDMFTSTTNTLVSRYIITDGLERIRNLSAETKPIFGYFEPIYDITKKESDTSDTPFKIINARFIPVEDNRSDEWTTIMVLEPDRRWRDRYFQGTDPIANETGASYMASTIWDRQIMIKRDETSVVTQAPVCMVYNRKQHDPKSTFLQCMLMGIYYDTNVVKYAVPELLENNIGTAYKEYREIKGFNKNLIYNSELPQEFRGGGASWGVNVTGKGSVRKRMVVSKMRELITSFAENIFFAIIFKELETYVNKQTDMGESWQPLDKRIYHDDALDGTTYAYIASLCYTHRTPHLIEELGKTTSRIRYIQVRDADGNLNRIPDMETITQN